MTIGHCKHGTFSLLDGCPKCIAERRQAGIKPDQDEMEDGLNAEGLTLSAATDYGKMAEESTDLNESPQAALTLIQPKLDPQVVAFYNEAVKLKEYAEARVITTISDLKPANDDLNIIRRLKKAMEARRKEYLAPFQDHVKEVNEAYKNLMQPVDIADKITTDKMLTFNREQDRIRREQEEINRLREQAAQKQKELTGEIAEVEVVEVVTEAPKHISTEMGSTGVREIWKWELTDFSLVPDDYKMINAGVLTPVVKASKGKIKIAGIRIYNDPILAVGR